MTNTGRKVNKTHLAQPVRPGRVALEVQGGAGRQHVADFGLLCIDGFGQHEQEEEGEEYHEWERGCGRRSRWHVSCRLPLPHVRLLRNPLLLRT